MQKHQKEIIKVYNEFFYQAEYILKKKGAIIVLTKNPESIVEAAKKHKFKIAKKYTVNQGEELFVILKFSRG